jgi:hypothetical protein
MNTWHSSIEKARQVLRPCVALATALSCGVPEPSEVTGGLSGIEEFQESGIAGACARGFVVVSSDYQSTSVGLLDGRGEVQSPRFISSASANAGLSAALSGDVVTSTLTATTNEIVLIDRYPAGVLSWVNLESGRVRAQLPVGTGFAANPHDYVPISPTKAYVPRFEPNFSPGATRFDEGNDLLIVDPSAPAILGRIDLGAALGSDEFYPRADRALKVGRWVYALLGAMSLDFTASTDAGLVVLDSETDNILQVLRISRAHGCTHLALHPGGRELAVACSGSWNGDNTPDSATSAIVRLAIDPETGTARELRRYPAATFGEGPIGSGLSYASESQLLFTTLGEFGGGSVSRKDDTLIELTLESGEFEIILRSNGEPFTLGDVRCECGLCLATDASRELGLHRFTVESGKLTALEPLSTEPDAGRLPPRTLGAF